ncbi:MAG: AmmeMemoRadiSam system radical SAM enzyme [Planctomycetota bacterium]
MHARFWHSLDQRTIQCDLCPRYCRLRPGQRGFCFVRENRGGRMLLSTYGRSSGFAVDPVEKKPLYHFLPGSSTLSFGTAGCNLACRFCQNWHISKSRSAHTNSVEATPEQIAATALRLGCSSVAYTYNDPVIFHEYAIDTALACRERGIRSVAVTAGQVTEEPRAEFFAAMDAANVDLKSFSSAFYRRHCSADLTCVLDTLQYIRHETDVWLEVTTLLIPTLNDSSHELEKMTLWFAENLGPDVPLHFSAFHPDWKLRDLPRTPLETLLRAREIALKNGIRFVYTGNVHYPEGGRTVCPGCKAVLIERVGYEITQRRLGDDGACKACGARIPGIYR